MKRKRTEPTLQISDVRAYVHVPRSYRNYLLHTSLGLCIIALVLIILVLARPQTTNSRRNSKIEGIDIISTADVSTSMLVKGLKPNRLEVTKDVTAEFINDHPNDSIGITLPVGESFTQCPLMVDHIVLLNLFQDIKYDITEDGTVVGIGIVSVVTRLKDSKTKSRVIILLIDGTSNKGDISPLTVAGIVKSSGIRIYTIGVGINGMAPCLVPVGGTVQHIDTPAETDGKTPIQMTGTTDGSYFHTTSNSKPKEIYGGIGRLEKTKLSVKEYSKRQEEYRWFVLTAFLCVLPELLLHNSMLRKIP